MIFQTSSTLTTTTTTTTTTRATTKMTLSYADAMKRKAQQRSGGAVASPPAPPSNTSASTPHPGSGAGDVTTKKTSQHTSSSNINATKNNIPKVPSQGVNSASATGPKTVWGTPAIRKPSSQDPNTIPPKQSQQNHSTKAPAAALSPTPAPFVPNKVKQQINMESHDDDGGGWIEANNGSNNKKKTVKKSNSAWKPPQQQQQPKQKQKQPASSMNKAKTKTTSKVPNSSSSSPWFTDSKSPITIATNPKHRNDSNNIKSTNAIAEGGNSSPAKGQQKVSASNNNTNNNNNKTKKNDKHDSKAKQQGNNPQQLQKNQQKQQSKQQQQQQQQPKSKKPKPTLASMSISDMISDPKKLAGNNGKKKTKEGKKSSESSNAGPKQQQRQQQQTFHVDSTQEFPSLGSVTSTPAKATKNLPWGAAAATTPASSEKVAASPSPQKALRKGEKVAPAPAPAQKKSAKKENSKKKEKATGGKSSNATPNAAASTKNSSAGASTVAGTGATPVDGKKKLMSVADFFKPKTARDVNTRSTDGDEHQLLRLMQDRHVYQKKGRQRVAPRKKKFTALKKKVLQERLDKWRASNPTTTTAPTKDGEVGNEQKDNNSNKESTDKSSTGQVKNYRSVCLYKYASNEDDELDDDDEYEEIVDNLRSMAEKVGPVEGIFIPRPSDDDDDNDFSQYSSSLKERTVDNYPSFVKFQNPTDASAATACWQGLVIGGDTLQVVLIDDSVPSTVVAAANNGDGDNGDKKEVEDKAKEPSWQGIVLAAEARLHIGLVQKGEGEENTLSNSTPQTVILENVLTEDDYEDEDCMEESLDDLRQIIEQFGHVHDIIAVANNAAAETHSSSSPSSSSYGNVQVSISLNDDLSSEGLVNELKQIMVSGQPLSAHVVLPENETTDLGTDQDQQTKNEYSIILENVLTEDDLEDDDCLEESLNDIRELAEQYGQVLSVQMMAEQTTKQKEADDNDNNNDDDGDDADDANNSKVQVTYAGGMEIAQSAVAALNGLCLGGMTVSAKLAITTTTMAAIPSSSSSSNDDDDGECSIHLQNILTEDDLEDEECLEESLDDIKTLASKYGKVSIIEVIASKEDKDAKNDKEDDNDIDDVIGDADDDKENENVATNDNQIVRIVYTSSSSGNNDTDDIDNNVNDNDDNQPPTNPITAARNAVEEFNGMVIGGQTVIASSTKVEARKATTTTTTIATTNDGKYSTTAVETPGGKINISSNEASAKEDEEKKNEPAKPPAPIYSGDKLIPERFAECKRVPKIPNASAGPREYAKPTLSKTTTDERVKPLLVEMLGELMRLQKRVMEEAHAANNAAANNNGSNNNNNKSGGGGGGGGGKTANAKARRRLVMGLREVARGIRAHKVKMVVMANNLDEYGAIDEKLQEIIDLAKKEDVPLFYEFTKRTLGKAIGKSIKIAVVGVQNADGAYQPYKKLMSIAAKL